jgi:hypothetical protein
MTPEQTARAGRILDALLARYEDILTNGEVVEINGESKSITPSAAMCGKIQDFLDRHSIGRAAMDSKPQDQISRISEKIRKGEMKLTRSTMPPIDDSDDAATIRIAG